MKKALLILGALLMVVAGVAAVSAYEAHIIDIKAHVENALIVPEEIDLGVVFPEEKLETNVSFGLSESFRAQTRVSDVDYALFWEPKPAPLDENGDPTICAAIEDDDGNFWYQDLGEFLTLQAPSETGDGAGADGYVGPDDGPDAFAHGNLSTPSDLIDTWHLIFNVPVFDKWYNPTTDPAVGTETGLPGILDEGQYCVEAESVTEGGITVNGEVPHADLGVNLKIQVFDYSYHID